MKVTFLEPRDVVLIEPDIHQDSRGKLIEMFQEERFAEIGLPTRFRQDNQSCSRRGVLRGLHYQLRRPQGKLVCCVQGAVFDVAVDIRRESPTFGRWVGVELSENNGHVLWVPPGMAHGYCALSENATVWYKCTELYAPDDECGILWSDPDIGIAWPVDDPILSERDRLWRGLRASSDRLPSFTPGPQSRQR